MIFLAFYRILYPKARADEINVFLYNANFGNVNFSFSSCSQIMEAKKLIGLSRKAGSLTAYQTFLPMNMQKRWNYWNLPYPMGIADIPRRCMIDLVEVGVFIESTNRGAWLGIRWSLCQQTRSKFQIRKMDLTSWNYWRRWHPRCSITSLE